jgi:uncharacterized protein (DUF2062 family)
MTPHFVETPLPPASDSVAPPSTAERPQGVRTFWQRRVRDPIVVQLTQGITPEKIALTLAVGSAMALFPAFGVTSLLCFLAALALRLNQPIIQILNQLLLPVHIGTFVLCVHFGEFLFRVPPEDRFHPNPNRLLEEYFTDFWSHPLHSLTSFAQALGGTLLYAIVAWLLLLPLFIPTVYYIARPIMRGIGKVKREVAAKKAAAAPPPEHPVP